MRHGIALLVAAILLAGCGTVGNALKKTGQVLMDPSIQVGAAEDQTSQIALSLYASPDVNPNPVSLPPVDPVEAPDQWPLEETLDGPFTVNVRSASKSELIEHLQTLLGQLQSEQKEALSAPAPDVLPHSPIPALDADDPTLPLSLITKRSETPSTRTAPPPRTRPSKEARHQAQKLSSTEEEHWNQALRHLDLGQYSSGTVLSPATDAHTTPTTATPISFRVLQLKDDSMLEHADPELLRKNASKALGSTLLASDDYILAPGQFKFIEFEAVNEKTRYIAVVADFHDPNAERWQDVFRIEPRGRKYPLMVMLQSTRVAITDESYRPTQNNFCPASQMSTNR